MIFEKEIIDEFYGVIENLLRQQDIQKMKDIRQHSKGVSCLDHSLYVSYISYRICKKLGLDAPAAARGGLLHDLHLTDRESASMNAWKWLYRHPQLALANAEKFDLTKLEKNIITSHMWPLSLTKIPRHREAFVVNFADNFCAIAEMLHLYRRSHISVWSKLFYGLTVTAPATAG